LGQAGGAFKEDGDVAGGSGLGVPQDKDNSFSSKNSRHGVSIRRDVQLDGADLVDKKSTRY